MDGSLVSDTGAHDAEAQSSDPAVFLPIVVAHCSDRFPGMRLAQLRNMRTRPSAFTASEKLLFTLLGSLAAFFGAAREAQACSILEPFVSLTSESVPVDGVVAGLLTCTSCTTEDLVVVDDQGNELVGAFETPNPELDARLFAWRPSAPFTVGATYRVQAREGLSYFDYDTFQATAASAAAPTAEATLERYTYGQDSVVCKQSEPPPNGGCGGTPYTPSTRRRCTKPTSF